MGRGRGRLGPPAYPSGRECQALPSSGGVAVGRWSRAHACPGVSRRRAGNGAYAAASPFDGRFAFFARVPLGDSHSVYPLQRYAR